MGMWWEIVPVFSVCVGIGYLPHLLQTGLHKLVYGTRFARYLDHTHAWYGYQRDRMHADPHLLSSRYYNKGSGVGEGFVYKTHGLEKYED